MRIVFGSYARRLREAAAARLARGGQAPPVTEEDLAHLPPPVQRYLRLAGAVGRPAVRNFRAVFTGRFRNGLSSPWMPFRAEQYNFVDDPARFFLLTARMFGLPIEGLHLYAGGKATMQIRAASLLEVADARGPEMNQGETVTLFNDLCLLAPPALVDRERIRWEPAGPLAARAAFTNAGMTVRALLSFNEAGELTNFVSEDRFYSTAGRRYERFPWSTPAGRYRDAAGRRVFGYAEAVWQLPEGPFCYGEFGLREIQYNRPAVEEHD